MIRTLIFALTALCLALFAFPASAGPGDDTHPVVHIEDFDVLQGDDWTGTLSYLNYNSEDRSTIPVKLQVSQVKGRSVKYAIQYPGEEEYNSRERIRLSKDGRTLDGRDVTSRETLADGTLVITTEGEGEDNDRPADLRFVYTLGSERFSIRKDVRFEEGGEFFNRNEYAFER